MGPILSCSIHAQSTKAELFGVINDSSGLPVAQAVVRLTNTGTNLASTQSTRTDGVYQFLALQAGSYRVTVEKPGFAPLQRDGILLRVGDRLDIPLALKVGDSSQTVEVTAAAPLLQSNRGSVSFMVEQQKVVTLPLDGRNFVPLIALSPGVTLPPGNLLPRVNGSRPRVSEYIYDGISVLQPEPGQVAFYPIIDAVDEFRVETNSYSAEYGRSNGGVIMVNQKAGSNELHGTLFEFFRNEKLNARNLFATTGVKPLFRRNQYGFVLGGPVQKDRTFFFVDWQGTRLNTGVVRTSTVPTTTQKAGVFSNSIFDPATTRRTDAGLARDAFAANTIPASRFDRATLAVLDRYPAPNVFTSSGAEATANNYRRTGSDTTAADQFDARLDRYMGARHRLFGRYSYLRDDSRPTAPLPDGSGNLTSGVIGSTLTRADSVAAEHTWSLSALSVNQVRFGYTRRTFDRASLQTGQSISQTTLIPNIPFSSFSDVLPTYDVVGFQQLGPPSSGNASFTTSVTQIIDNFSWVRGGHSLKAGADIRREALDVLQPPSPTGNFQFTNIFTSGLTPAGTAVSGTGNSVASFLVGQVGRFSIDAQPQVIQPRATVAEFFLQDDWRATRRLSLNLGVRYTLNFPSTVVDNRGAVFNLNTQKLDFLGQNGFPRGARDLEKKNFAPRVGLAFKVTDSFVIRSGYGMTWIEQAGITTPFTTPLFPFIQTLGQQSLDNINPAFVLSQGPTVAPRDPNPDSGLGQGVFGVQRGNGSGYAQQWNLTLQRTFGEDWSVEAGYLGSKLTRLGVPDVNLNQLTVEQLGLGSQLTQQVSNPYFGEIPSNTSLGTPSIARGQLLRPYPRFTTVTLYRNNTGHSTYHSFQSRLEKRFSAGLTLSVAYTFSRLIDDAGAVFDSAILTGPVANFQAADSFNKRLEKDVSTGNIPHVFSSGFVYQLPLGQGRKRSLHGWKETLGGGWQVGGVIRAQSGSPIAITQVTNYNAFAGFGIQRPNRTADPALPADQRSTGRWFNTAAFVLAPQFTIGSSSRNPVSGPGYRTVDLMVGKRFPIAERVYAEFRAEAFNVTNTPPLGNPNGSFGNAAFGTITTALDPRVFELALKLQF
ncbi:TonB-dependent receptor [uncultured Paludibaculum sp.]|uniref:TonB-dependent receptor n=1 Tax=uncultured Paludibaculum sp. TaxID=1765020 RepID=UPI002AAB57E3|nr:TonB-dependent receptor [uncultured Paludibaculum sp.]